MNAVSKNAPFDLLYEEPASSLQTSYPLVSAVQEIYQGQWSLPVSQGKPYCFSNFVMSHDGRVSFAVPGHEGGGDVSDFNAHDQWLMGLLRSRADAVMVGANTLRSESEHIWTSDFIAPAHAGLFSEQRQSEGRELHPLQVFVTQSGNIDASAAVFHHPELRSLVITTDEGKSVAQKRSLPGTEVISSGDIQVDFVRALDILASEFGVSSLLCEGGPRVYASLVASGVVDEEFLTLSPVVMGSTADNPRPGLVEGFAYQPGSSARAELVSVRRANHHLFLRTRLRTP